MFCYHRLYYTKLYFSNISFGAKIEDDPVEFVANLSKIRFV